MKPFTHILVPIDFGDSTAPAVDLALALARSLDARVTVMNSFDLTPFTMLTPLTPMLDVEPLVASAQAELTKLVANARTNWPKTEGELRRGSPYDTILETAREHGCDVIVMGTHGRRGIAHVLLGSVAERIVRFSPIPVLTVHPPEHGEKAARRPRAPAKLSGLA